MKTSIYLIIGTVLAISTSCRDQGSLPQAPPETHKPYRPYYAPGQVMVTFVDSVTSSEAEQFIRGLSLTPIDLSLIDTHTTHFGRVAVPIGQERMWADSLKKYPALVQNADLVWILEVTTSAA